MILLSILFSLIHPNSAWSQTWRLECKPDKKIACEAGKCSVEDTLSVELHLAPGKASVGIYSMILESKPRLVTKKSGKKIDSISFLISGRPKSGSVRLKEAYTVTGYIDWETKKFSMMLEGGDLYQGTCTDAKKKK